VKIWITLAVGVLSLLTIWFEAQSRFHQKRGSNIRSAEKRLRWLAAAEADFRGNDRDGNGVQDYWTGDVAGLYQWGLIDQATAMADLRPLNPLVPSPVPADGYFYLALDVDASVDPPEPYRQGTGGTRHPAKFGFLAIPAKGELNDGHRVIISESNSPRWNWMEWKGEAYFPSDAELRTYWSRR
jgi:hypothetical protein